MGGQASQPACTKIYAVMVEAHPTTCWRTLVSVHCGSFVVKETWRLTVAPHWEFVCVCPFPCLVRASQDQGVDASNNSSSSNAMHEQGWQEPEILKRRIINGRRATWLIRERNDYDTCATRRLCQCELWCGCHYVWYGIICVLITAACVPYHLLWISGVEQSTV
jgi:hypothetical protein